MVTFFRIWIRWISNRAFFATLRWHIRLVWSRYGYFGLTSTRQKTNHGSTKLAWYAIEAHQKCAIRQKNRPGVRNNMISLWSYTYLDTLRGNRKWSQILCLTWDRPLRHTSGTAFFCQHHTWQNTLSRGTILTLQLYNKKNRVSSCVIYRTFRYYFFFNCRWAIDLLHTNLACVSKQFPLTNFAKVLLE